MERWKQQQWIHHRREFLQGDSRTVFDVWLWWGRVEKETLGCSGRIQDPWACAYTGVANRHSGSVPEAARRALRQWTQWLRPRGQYGGSGPAGPGGGGQLRAESQGPASGDCGQRLIDVHRDSRRSLHFNFQWKEFQSWNEFGKNNLLSFPGIEELIFLLAGRMEFKVKIKLLWKSYILDD